MNFYPHHIGDFLKDTSFMSNEEQMIYLKLIWLYYDTEQPLPNDILVLSMKCNCRDKNEELKGILVLFFKADGDFWRHTRCDEEIAKYHNIITERSKAGKASAAKRVLNKSSTSVEQVLNIGSTKAQQNATNQEPRTKNQEVNNKTLVDTDVSPPVDKLQKGINCPHQKLLDLYHAECKSLAKVARYTESRKAAMTGLWKAVMKEEKYTTEARGLEYFEGYFNWVEQSDFLCGRTGNGQFMATFDWILKPANFTKTIEGNYHRRAA